MLQGTKDECGGTIYRPYQTGGADEYAACRSHRAKRVCKNAGETPIRLRSGQARATRARRTVAKNQRRAQHAVAAVR